MAVKHTTSYADYVTAMRQISGLDTAEAFPRLAVIYGSSDFLRMKTVAAFAAKWRKVRGEDPQSIEGIELDHVGFNALWNQNSLFDPDALYSVRRCDRVSKIGVWLKEIKSHNSIRNHLLLDFDEKIPAEIQRQCTRLQGVFIPCTEPTALGDFVKVLHGMARRERILLEDEAAKFLIDALGLDLAKLDNELKILGLLYQGRREPLKVHEIASQIGAIREDHVFQLFNLLRNRQKGNAQLLLDQLLERGEKAIALTGILARYSREMVQKSSKQGARALMLCSQTDLQLKSSSVSEALLLGRIVEALAE